MNVNNGKEKSNTDGVKTTRPNEYLHIDTTYKKMQNGDTSAVVFVSDNFSKTILGWEIAHKNNALNIVNALKMAKQTMLKNTSETPLPCILMADGGAENHASIVEDLLKEDTNPAIQKIIAQKDIQFSNSPVEAINKIFKRYVRMMKPKNFEELKKILPLIVEDYNKKLPHGTLKGLTPWECYTQNYPDFDFKQQIQQQKPIRIAQNKQFNCAISC